MNKQIIAADMKDMQAICDLFEQAIAFIQQHNYIGWSVYDRATIQADIEKKQLYKIISGNDLLGIFTVYTADPLIWGDKEKGDAVYLHRIVLNQAFRGEKLFRSILDWTRNYAGYYQLRYIRMDTWAANEKLINYYKTYGFRFTGHYNTTDTDELPVQHRNLHLALLQIDMALRKKNNAIYIIGAGAIGKALAVFLAQQGKTPILIRGSIDDRSSYLQHIEVELADHSLLAADVLVSTASNYERFDNLVVFTNKSYGNSLLAEQLKTKIGDTPVVILQNGLTVEQSFIDNGYLHIYRCVLFTSSQFTDTGKLKFKPAKPSRIGMIRGTMDTLAFVVEQLSNKYLQFEAERDIQPVIWTKAIANCVFNSICPLLETDNGIFHRDKQALSIAEKVIDECIEVAASASVHLKREDVLATMLHISHTSDGQRISTYEDILHHRQTEIGTLNLAVADIAQRYGNTTGVQNTRLLGELIMIKSNR